MDLILDPHLPEPDRFYADLIACLRDLDDAQAERFQARLLLILANHVGDHAVLDQALAAASLAIETDQP